MHRDVDGARLFANVFKDINLTTLWPGGAINIGTQEPKS